MMKRADKVQGLLRGITMTIGAVVVLGCSGNEQTQLSPTFQHLPPEVARERLKGVLKYRGMENKVDKVLKDNGAAYAAH